MTPLAPMLLAALATLSGSRQDGPQPIRHTAAQETRPGTPAAAFELIDVDGEAFELELACAEGYVLLVFVRGMW